MSIESIRNSLGVFAIALAALLLEINLIRVFDVLWYPNMSYMVITLAVFAFGLAGVYLSVRPPQKENLLVNLLGILFCMTLWVLMMPWAIDRLPFDYTQLGTANTLSVAINFFLIYIVICVPFFLAGLVLSIVFTLYSSQIRRLYFWDLLGASLGCLLLVPLITKVGAVGVLWAVAFFVALSGLAFSIGLNRVITVSILFACAITIVVPLTQEEIGSFKPHMDKRSYKKSLEGNIADGVWWDPISKITVFDTEKIGQKRKWIAYDGGTQSSYFHRFDGDYDSLRRSLPQDARKHFWNVYVAISHYLKADTDANVLIIGSAGGQELKAALTYGAGHVDAIELVGSVVALGKTKYADYTGNIMNDPRAVVQRGEGRSFLRQSKKTYDIIQMFSNHTSSSIAAGSGSMQSAYLQTVEAYKEYFTHLSEDGILHINHHIYPKMVATAARAWAELGRTDFRKHVLVSDSPGVRDDLPTMLIKMSPWTQEEVNKVKSMMRRFDYPVDPFDAENSFLPDEFFIGKLPQSVIDAAPYRIEEPTDNKPFFNSLRVSLDTLPKYDKSKYVNVGVSELLNSQKSTGYPVDVMHLIVSAGAALVFALIFTFGPLMFAKAGREKWEGKGSFVTYFCCLGLGFIVYELVFIQIFMKVIGFPLYTYTVVLFTFLFGAGFGSLASEKLRLYERRQIWVPFVGIAVSTLLVILCQQFVFDSLLELRTMLRMLASIVIIFPLAFFLGMPFPMGVLAIENKPKGTIAWAWGLNGLFTVTGGIFCAIFSVFYGFIATMFVATLAYLIAYIAYRNLYKTAQIQAIA